MRPGVNGVDGIRVNGENVPPVLLQTIAFFVVVAPLSSIGAVVVSVIFDADFCLRPCKI